jgi:hypothetical protein
MQRECRQGLKAVGAGAGAQKTIRRGPWAANDAPTRAGVLIHDLHDHARTFGNYRVCRRAPVRVAWQDCGEVALVS